MQHCPNYTKGFNWKTVVIKYVNKEIVMSTFLYMVLKKSKIDVK